MCGAAAVLPIAVSISIKTSESVTSHGSPRVAPPLVAKVACADVPSMKQFRAENRGSIFHGSPVWRWLARQNEAETRRTNLHSKQLRRCGAGRRSLRLEQVWARCFPQHAAQELSNAGPDHDPTTAAPQRDDEQICDFFMVVFFFCALFDLRAQLASLSMPSTCWLMLSMINPVFAWEGLLLLLTCSRTVLSKSVASLPSMTFPRTSGIGTAVPQPENSPSSFLRLLRGS